MKTTYRARYYVIAVHEGNHKAHAVRSLADAIEDFDDLAKRPGVVALGIYDPQDWAMLWQVSEETKKEHYDNVLDLTIPLNWT